MQKIKTVSDAIVCEQSEEIRELIAQEWEIESLDRILSDNISYQNKLEKISLLWEDVGYPKDWESLIYYMPAKEGEPEKDIVVRAGYFAKSKKIELENIKQKLFRNSSSQNKF